MPAIVLRGVTKSYVSGQYAVRNLDMTIPDGAFMCLLGPSGCGKTTTLRMIAGLEQPTAGEIAVGNRVLDSVAGGVYVPPEKRGMGLVFQSYALWPHMTVRRNIEFGLRMRKVPTTERGRRVTASMELLRIGDYGDRYPSQLSGGQQQRVALARMLAVDPEVLLLDEPLSNLDARLRLEMRAEIKRIHQRSGSTAVLVTHDQLEAMTMATHVAVMNDGVVQQLAPPLEVYGRPATVFVAEFVGSPPMNLVPLAAPGGSGLGAELAGFVAGHLRPAGSGTVGVRPEALGLADSPADVPAGAWSCPADVEAVLPTGSAWTVQLRCRDREVFAQSYRPVEAAVGDRRVIWARPGDLHLFDAAGTRVPSWDRDAGTGPDAALAGAPGPGPGEVAR